MHWDEGPQRSAITRHTDIQHVERHAELRGRTIEAGDRLALVYPSANRDEDEIDVEPNIFAPAVRSFGRGFDAR